MKRYELPEIELVRMDTADIVATSNAFDPFLGEDDHLDSLEIEV